MPQNAFAKDNYLSWGALSIGADKCAESINKVYSDTGELNKVKVAVLDTGIDYNHPFLQGRINSCKYDFVDSDNDGMDEQGHGTAVAGIIADVTFDNVQINGYRIADKYGEATCEALFSHEPFKKLKSRFNLVAVASPSADSGVSIPLKDEWKSTAVSSHFSTFYSDRYLTTSRVKSIHNWLAGIPYEHVIILANTDTYGGGGIYNSYTLTTAHHPQFKPVVVHEFGHSFGGLADEYAYTDAPSPLYPYSIETWEQNITTMVDFESKWKDMVPEGTPVPTPAKTQESEIYTSVGVYEGAGYTTKGIYRPATECRMKNNEAPAFCPVCQRALERLILFYTEK